ncbi:DUF354 domain-containing protein [Methanolobus sp. WCC4]|uniref:DUF354 domain-containing protein n=1 Tax=Methanolobus sp. WCC4 TaxID=3125784 RepID=UPI0030FD1D4C
MRLLIDIGHPSHVHFFKNIITSMESKGHNIIITSRNKDVALDLLDAYNLSYFLVGESKKGFLNKALNVLSVERNIYKIAKKFKPDVFLGASGNFYVAHVATLLGKPSIIFEDSEPDLSVRLLCKPFVTYFFTPELFFLNLGQKKHIRYKGYKELAYLHPNYFHPDSQILTELNLEHDEKFTLFRFVDWAAVHDVGQSGMDGEWKHKFVHEMSKYGKVFISSESKLPSEFAQYELKISPAKLHDLLYFSHIFICDSQTMATEASILGVPTIRSNSFVGTMSNFKELQEKYGLLYSYKDSQKAYDKAVELQNENDVKIKWNMQKMRLLEDKIDVTSFVVELLAGYPQSCIDMIKHKR